MNSTVITNEVVEITKLNKETIYSLSNSGRIISKKDGKGYLYDLSSVNIFLTTFNRDDYYTVSEVTQILKDNGLVDTFQYFGDKNSKGKKLCKYVRLMDFPLSVKQLILRGYFEIDKDITPRLISKDSVINTIKQLNGMRGNTPSNNTNYTKSSKKVS